ncbi:MAG: HAD-IC family P-type ATPase, partial [Bacteroidales bacterium]|nr:HAD-IC family P-type ATPase [Bacteroidales bacterium]
MNQTHHYEGLTDAQVLESKEKHGINILTPPKRESLWSKFIDCFSDPLIRILLIALLLSIGISVYQFFWGGADASVFFEPAGILIAVLLATMVGFFLELSNEKTFQSLNEVNDETLVKVIRNGNVCEVQRKEIVVGDIVLLEIGEEVPADCELLESFNLIMNESSLTGEPQCNKTTDPAHFDKDATYPSNHVLKGTTIIEGYCTAKVIRVGDSTECGKVFKAAQVEEGDPTPLSKKLDWLSKIITTASYIIAGLIIVGRLVVYFVQGDADFGETEGIIAFVKYILDTIMIAVTLIVVAVPEGLPMSVTLSLAFSMKRLMKQNTLPRTMHSCETMGATSVICTDKTGTLTQNQMKIHDTFFESLTDQKLTDDKASHLLEECIAMDT